METKFSNMAMLEELGEIGKTADGGVTRFSFSDNDVKARERIFMWMKELGMTIREDEAGNIIARYGSGEGPAIALGSHIDSVPNGGIFDGPLGVVLAVNTLRALIEDNVEFNNPLEIIVFSDEEGARFGGGLFGSKVMTGTLEEDALSRKDKEGISAYDALKAYGYEPDNLSKARRYPEDFKAYIEVHIEQAKVLEDIDYPVGIVSGIAGIVRFDAELFGKADHAGATPMNLRQDALLGAAKAIIAAEDIANRAGETTVATVGQIEVKPCAANVIPGYAKFSFDVRDTNITDREWAVMEIKQELQRIAEDLDLDLRITDIISVPPAEINEDLIKLAEDLAIKENIKAHTMVSGAAHDAMNMTLLTDVLMLFVNSRDGVSHCPEEFSSEEHIDEANKLLYHIVKELVTN
jgi:hydantoinase/carbamoylase family amidase